MDSALVILYLFIYVACTLFALAVIIPIALAAWTIIILNEFIRLLCKAIRHTRPYRKLRRFFRRFKDSDDDENSRI